MDEKLKQSTEGKEFCNYFSDEDIIKKLTGMLSLGIWSNRKDTVQACISFYKNNMTMRPVLGTGGLPVSVPPSPDTIKAFILREGEQLSKEEKKQAGINPLAKIGKNVFLYFTEKGLKVCVAEAETLGLAICHVIGELDKIQRWKEWKIKTIKFAPAPDACPICVALAGEYPIKKCPVPILDTHLGCRCSVLPI